LRQAAQLARLTWRYDFSPEDYYRYRMYRLADREAALFVPLEANIAIRTQLYRKLGLDPRLLADKRLFGRACATAGLPVAETLADFERGEVHWWTSEALPPADLFVKEAASMCGDGAAQWSYDGAGTWSHRELLLDQPQLLQHLAAASGRDALLLQRRLVNHPAVADLGPSGLCTVRVVTTRDPGPGRPTTLLAVFRMATGGDVADNFARGGLAAPVDIATGVMGKAVRKDLAIAHVDIESHPDTGAPIAGRTLPCWSDVLALAARAHDAFADYPSVGWDIAITPGGPVLLEANYNWDVVLGQQAGCRPLGATDWPRHFQAWLDWAESREQAR
jgi:hypothetical protein